MRITSINSSFANGIRRFGNAGTEMFRALLPVEPTLQSVQTRLHACLGYLAGDLPSGNSRTAIQSWFWDVTAKPSGMSALATNAGSIDAMQLPAQEDSRDLVTTTVFSLRKNRIK